jgi:adenylate cyclase
MNQEEFKRRLTAILSADVEGYSLLMREDEEATIRTLKTYRTAMRNLIQRYRGRVVDSPGDNILSEFSSVVDAVNCAVEIQRELAERNSELPHERRMRFRIGVNLGDVVEDGERIYGDGVNIAARMEGLAEGGGICISGTVYDQVKHKLGLEYEYLGEQEVKNMPEPIRAYRILSYPGAAAHRVVKAKRAVGKTWRNVVVAIVAVLVVGAAVAIWHFYFRPPSQEVASVEKMAFPLPDKPSIAVLPFVNMSGDPKQEYFSDGLTDQIINGLSKVPDLFVIARNSTFTYKGKPVKVQKIAEDLGVKYILEGSVQKTTDRIRITTQLIDATTGRHLWSERYDRDLKDIFAIQDDITMETMKAMRVELRGDQARMWVKHETTNLQAYEKFLEAGSYWRRFTKGDNAQARQLFEEAVAIDPQFAAAYALVGWTHFIDARFGWTESRVKSIKMAFIYAQKTLEMDDTIDYAHTLLSAVYLLKRQYEKAVAAAEHAITLNPNGAILYDTLAGVVGCSGRWEDSIIYAKKSIRLAPFPQITVFHWLGRAYFMTGQYDEAILTFKKALGISPNYLPAHAFLAASYSSLGRETEAVAAAEEVLRINPKFCLESYAKTLPYKNKSDIERYMAALRKAGLPKTPPLPLPDKPSIAVLPFANMSGDPEQEYFSDGVTESIITALSKAPRLFVISRSSTFTYKGKPVNVKEVSRELGARYVLEGSVQRSEDRVRITAQLIDATTGSHIWAERYDRDLRDVFALQDEITMKIVAAMQLKLTEGETARLHLKGTNNLEAYTKWVSLQSRSFH